MPSLFYTLGYKHINVESKKDTTTYPLITLFKNRIVQLKVIDENIILISVHTKDCPLSHNDLHKFPIQKRQNLPIFRISILCNF